MKGGGYMDAAKKIKQYIADNGLKQIYVAEKAGIEFAVFNAILNGKTRLDVERLERISKALGVEPGFFLSQSS